MEAMSATGLSHPFMAQGSLLPATLAGLLSIAVICEISKVGFSPQLLGVLHLEIQ